MKERATANDVPFTPLDKLFEPTVPQGPELPVVDAQPEPEGQRIALDMEMFVKGSLNTSAQQTNVDLNSALIAFDIRELDSTLLPLGMLVVLDAIYNRLLRNQRQGRET